jgi:glycosyltransferase involved in cell wall biosynthesis
MSLNAISVPFVSVIIPVFNDSERLRQCLQALERQTYAQDAYEVIVVDNNSDEDIQSVVAPFSQVRFAKESRQGSYAARNQGISLAKGEILAFTDSDCVPALDWLEQGVKVLLANPNCGLVAGKIEFFFKNPQHPTATELYDSFTFLQQEQYVKELRFGATANLFVYRQMFEKVGLFNADLKSGGDQEWGKRVFAAGYPQVYADQVRIGHPARHDLKELRRKLYRVSEGKFFINSHNLPPLNAFIKEVALDIRPPIRTVLRMLADTRIERVPQRFWVMLIFLSFRYERLLTKLQLYWRYRWLQQRTTSQ